MKYIKLFKTTAGYQAYAADIANFITPNVSLCEDDVTTVYYTADNSSQGGNTPTPSHDYSQDYFTIVNIGAEPLSFGLSNKFQYSLDDGSTWADGTDIMNVPINSKVLVKGNYENFVTSGSGSGSGSGEDSPINIPNLLTSYANTYYAVEGNIMSLVYGDNFIGKTDLTEHNIIFKDLFNITNGDEWLKSAENLILPATTLTRDCYNSMFRNCSSLTTAPELPATTLVEGCYKEMFYGCESLTTASELPATTLTRDCYNGMFSNCTSLTTAPVLPATTLDIDCYLYMFYGCSSLTTAPELPATTLAESCYCYMFAACTSLTTAPELPATILNSQSYYCMFSGCTSLNYIKCLATDISAFNCTTGLLGNVASTGTFVKNANMTDWPTGANGIPSGWTVQDAA